MCATTNYKLQIQHAFKSFHTVVGISSGRSHTIFLTSESTVFTFGSGHFGQLGHGNDSYQVNPKEVKGVDILMPEYYKAVSVTAGGNHTLVTCRGEGVEDDDVIMSFGFNSSGQCGVGTYSNTLLQPQYVVGFEPKGAKNRGRLPPPLPSDGYVPAPANTGQSSTALRATSLTAGLSHTVCSTNRGTVYSWGDGKFGKLGVSVIPPTRDGGKGGESRGKKKRIEKACTPIPIRFPPRGNAGFYSVHAGGDFTFSVLYDDAELTCVRNVYSWGYGSEVSEARWQSEATRMCSNQQCLLATFVKSKSNQQL